MLDPATAKIALRDHPDGATIRLHVVPRAPRTRMVGRHGQAVKLKVHAPPVEGAANAEVLAHLADLCGVRGSEVVLLSGRRSRDKVVLVRGWSAADLRERLTGRR